jgi:NADP-dependent 3-hydroxy acid dehydrogenase YdfG
MKKDNMTRALDGVRADVLVNNAGVGYLKPLLELTPEEWNAMVDVNFNALFHVTRAVLPGMVERGRGHIVMVGSIAGRSAFVGGACYAATKHAVMGFSESLMLEVRDKGVKVSVVNPGSVATGFFRGERDTSWMLTADDVADAVIDALDTPPRVLVHRIEVRAAMPKKG